MTITFKRPRGGTRKAPTRTISVGPAPKGPGPSAPSAQTAPKAPPSKGDKKAARQSQRAAQKAARQSQRAAQKAARQAQRAAQKSAKKAAKQAKKGDSALQAAADAVAAQASGQKNAQAHAFAASSGSAGGGGSGGKKPTTPDTPAAAGPLVTEFIFLEDRKSNGTGGGSSSALTIHTRVLNTEVFNGITGASLAANQVTLPAGTYWFEGWVGGVENELTKAFIYNVTGSINALIGMSTYEFFSADGVRHPVFGRVTITGTTVFELRHYVQRARATDGLGLSVGDGRGEVYSQLLIRKI